LEEEQALSRQQQEKQQGIEKLQLDRLLKSDQRREQKEFQKGHAARVKDFLKQQKDFQTANKKTLSKTDLQQATLSQREEFNAKQKQLEQEFKDKQAKEQKGKY